MPFLDGRCTSGFLCPLAHNSSAIGDTAGEKYFKTDSHLLRPKEFFAVGFPIGFLELWKSKNIEMWIPYNSWEECFRDVHGEMGLTGVPDNHPYRRRDIRDWAREHIVDYLQIHYMDHDWEDNALNAMQTGTLDASTFRFEQGKDEEKPVAWANAFSETV